MAVTLSSPSSALSPLANRQELTPATALRAAWISYLVLLLIPFSLFVAVLWATMYGDAGTSLEAMTTSTWAWFIGCMAYLALVVPAAIFCRSMLFHPYWQGQPVPPAAYLKGTLAVWIALEIGGILSLASCLASGALMPGLMPAAVSLIWFLPLYPDGHAMLPNKGQSDDPEKYTEPR